MGIFTKLLLKVIKGLLEQFKKQAAATPEQWDDVVADVLLQIVGSLDAQGDRKLGEPDIKAILAEAQAKLVG